MAIVKIISHGKNQPATRKIMSYILNPAKTEPSLCGALGDIENENLTPKTAYQEFMRIRKLFNKEGGRTYTHGTVSWAPEEKITHEAAAAFADEFLSKTFAGHQVIYAVHRDTDHVHFHFVVNPANYLDGHMLHWSKYDLEEAKELCDEMCGQRGLSITQKGHHFGGETFAAGEITAWSKDKFNELIRNPKQSYLIDAALAVQNTVLSACSREEFCSILENEFGWHVLWQDTRKHITFTDTDGHKVRDSNLSKTFNIDISKEVLEREFERNRERRKEANTAGVAGAYRKSAEANSAAGSREGSPVQREDDAASAAPIQRPDYRATGPAAGKHHRKGR